MKLEKLPNMPEPFGVRITDIPPIEEMTRSEWRELGQVALKHLVWSLEGQQNLSKEKFSRLCYSWGKPGRWNPSDSQIFESLEPEIKSSITDVIMKISYNTKLPGLGRVTGIKDEQGDFTGIFPDGELEWHSNESGRQNPYPVLLLHAIHGTYGTQTQFLENVTEYEKLSYQDRKFVDSLICVYEWNPEHMDKTIKGTSVPEIHKIIGKINAFPKEGENFRPLISTSPGGHKGFAFNFFAFTRFKDKTTEESTEIIDWLKNLLIKEDRIYTHDWKDGDIVAFDQIVTLHKRPTSDCSSRLLHRMSCNFDKIIKDYNENN